MKTNLIRSNQRGHFNYEWLDTYYTFSFGEYYNRDGMGFGDLCVFNDDTISPQTGFPMHGHSNIEIVTIILEGVYEHQDNFGNRGQLNAGELQLISAGTGILHSGTNPSSDKNVNLFQIWIQPKVKNVRPKYSQINFAKRLTTHNIWHTLVSPNETDDALTINQNAYLSLGVFSIASSGYHYKLFDATNALFIVVVDGCISINDNILNKKDTILLEDLSEIEFMVKENSQLLVIEVNQN